MSSAFVQINGKSFVREGKELRFRGLGIGSWLNLEHFMIGLPGNDRRLRRTVEEVFGSDTASSFFEKLEDSFVTERDFQFLRECGVNVIRVPFNYRLLLDDNAPGDFREKGFAVFDRLLNLCEKYEIYLLPDLHAVPGGQNPDWHSDNDTGIPQFWQYKMFRDSMVALWGELAVRWKDREYLLGYDLLNEPWLIDAPEELLLEFFENATAAIRKTDKNHIIFLEGDHFAMNFDAIREISDANTALTFHFYPTVWEPDLLGEKYTREARKEKFREILLSIISCRNRLGRPVLCGEAGYEICKLGAEYSMELLGDTVDLFEEEDISWIVWCYKDARFMGLVFPKEDSGWMKLAAKIAPYWSQDIEKAQANAVMDLIGEAPGLKASEDELKYEMQFCQRAILFRFQAERILKPALEELSPERLLRSTEDFLFENCEIEPAFAELFRKRM